MVNILSLHTCKDPSFWSLYSPWSCSAQSLTSESFLFLQKERLDFLWEKKKFEITQTWDSWSFYYCAAEPQGYNVCSSPSWAYASRLDPILAVEKGETQVKTRRVGYLRKRGEFTWLVPADKAAPAGWDWHWSSSSPCTIACPCAQHRLMQGSWGRG